MFISFLAFLSAQTIVSQNLEPRTVKGIVTDETGFPVIGANVIQKGVPTNGGTTGLDGDFTISLPPNATIVVSYIGYITQEVNVGNNLTVNIQIKEDSQALSEVVVTALGMTRDKKALGYAMTELKGDDLLKSNVANPITALQGKVAGVQIDMGTAGPQSSQRILIRGNTSLSGNNQPIFVIDGIIIENDIKIGDKFDRDFGNDIKNLNFDDFETVSVLKGAAATALYGSRASNGVILITTKKGKKGGGLGISVSHTQIWDKPYKYPDFQNEFGMGSYPLWPIGSDGQISRNIAPGVNFGPRYDYQPYTVNSIYDGIFQPYKNNLSELYETGRTLNTNVAISGGSDKSTFRFSYSNRQDDGLTPNNEFDRNTLALNVTHDISRIVSAEAGFTYVNTDARNPTYQGGDRSPVYDFAFSVPRDYDTKYWKKNYWSANRDGYNGDDPFGYSGTLFDFYENNEYQKENTYRGYLNVNFKITDWLKVTLKGDMNNVYKKYEKKTLATDKTDFKGAAYVLNEDQRNQYKLGGMINAVKQFGDFSFNGTLGIERYDDEQSYHKSKTNNGLRVPGVFELNNSVDPATTEAYSKIKRRRINSIYALISTDWRGQVFLDLSGRNDWSSTLRYVNGTGNVSYFYPSVSASWLLTETFREKIPQVISFAKLRASYAITGKDTDPYLITDPGTYKYYNSFKDDYFGGGTYPYFEFANKNLGALNLKPEQTYAIEFGFDYRMFNNRFGIDLAYYKTNSKNQIMELATSSETGVENRIINAGDIENQGFELLITGTPIQTKDWNWDISLTLTKNENKVKKLYPGVTKYQLGTGHSETEAWATEGGAYGDIYSSNAYKRDENGNILLNAAGTWLRSGTSEKIGSLQPDLLGGINTSLTWKGFTLGAIIDARFGGDIFSGSYNYGMAGGVLKSTLRGRIQEYGGLERTLPDGRTVYDGMIPEGVFEPGVVKNGVDVSGMSYQDAYDKGLVDPISAYTYYRYKYDWANGIREASMHKLSWIALREISLYWNIPTKWLSKVFISNASLGLTIRDVGYLYNSLPDDIQPEGLKSNASWEYVETGGSVFSRKYGITLNLNF